MQSPRLVRPCEPRPPGRKPVQLDAIRIEQVSRNAADFNIQALLSEVAPGLASAALRGREGRLTNLIGRHQATEYSAPRRCMATVSTRISKAAWQDDFSQSLCWRPLPARSRSSTKPLSTASSGSRRRVGEAERLLRMRVLDVFRASRLLERRRSLCAVRRQVPALMAQAGQHAPLGRASNCSRRTGARRLPSVSCFARRRRAATIVWSNSIGAATRSITLPIRRTTSRRPRIHRGQMTNRPHRPAFEIIFIHDDSQRTLSIWHRRPEGRIRGSCRWRLRRAVLGREIPAESPRDDRVYDLDVFLDPALSVSAAAELGIARAEVRQMDVALGDRSRTRSA